MKPDEISAVRTALPETATFHYYPDRESPWLLARTMVGDARVADLKASPLAKFLDRPLVKPLVAGSGGVLRHRDMLALAHADRAMAIGGLSQAAEGALASIFTLPWQDFEISYDTWGVDDNWQWAQLSRKGGNLVMQLGFPSGHAEILGRHFREPMRKVFEIDDHPVRKHGRPTLAWVRIDMDLATGVALIEEVQSDWLRTVGWRSDRLSRTDPKSRDLAVNLAYEAQITRAYAKSWAKAALLAALSVLVEDFAMREIWMHMPEPGAVMKHIRRTKPPRSLYTALPKSFGFVAVSEAPAFLRSRRKDLRDLRKTGQPLFWKLDLVS